MTAPQGATFVWEGGDLWYPRHILAKLGRTDIRVVEVSYLADYLRGRYGIPVIVDHAARLTRLQWETLHVYETLYVYESKRRVLDDNNSI